MKCSELMNPSPEFCVPEERLMDALEIMRAHDVGSVPVVDNRDDQSPVGVITDRDAALFLGLEDRRPSEVFCREVMTSPPVTVSADDDIDEARDRMREFQLRRILVEKQGRLIGVIALADFAREKPGEAKKVVEDVSRPKAA